MNDIDISGTYRVGELSATYAEIVAAFGEPNDKGDGCKTQVEWHLKSPTGDIATIYDYKQSVAYNGPDGIPTEKVTCWSIGGRNPAVADWVQARVRKLASLPVLPSQPDHLLHLTLTWAARNLLTMTDDWRNRRVLLAGERVSDEVEMAANALYTQGLIFVVASGILTPPGMIKLTDEGKVQLAEWDALAAGFTESPA